MTLAIHEALIRYIVGGDGMGMGMDINDRWRGKVIHEIPTEDPRLPSIHPSSRLRTTLHLRLSARETQSRRPTFPLNRDDLLSRR